MQKLCFALALFLTFYLASAQNITRSCDNVLFRDRTDDFWEYFLYHDTPQPYTRDSFACRFHFAPGDDQCCTQVWYDALAAGWLHVRARAALAVMRARVVRSIWVAARDKFRPVRDEVDRARDRGEIDANTHDALIRYINSVLEAWDRFIDRLINDWARCLSMWLNYVAGILCLGCDPEWERYIYEANGRIYLRLTPDTCDDIRNGCLPVWQLIFELINDLVVAGNQLRIDLGQPPIDYNGTTICNGDCGAWLCDVFFGGRDSQLDTALPEPQDNTADAAGKRRSNANHVEAVFTHLESQVSAHYTKHGGAEFVQTFSDLLWTSHSAVKAMEDVHNFDYKRQATGQSNVYDPTGFSATKVGENSGLDTYVEGDSGAAVVLSSWLSFFF
jgi:hypothetical protein